MDETILIQGDSLPLPRQTVPYRDTWPGLLREATDGHVVNRACSEKMTADLHDQRPVFRKRELEYYEPTYVVVQLGIVDAVPRYISRTEQELLRAVPFTLFSRGLSHLLTKLRSRSEERAYVSQSDFEQNLREFLERSEAIGVDTVVVKILTAGDKYESKNPEAQAAIGKYNDIIDDVTSTIPSAVAIRPLADSESGEREIVDDHTLEEGYHLNTDGHALLYKRISDAL